MPKTHLCTTAYDVANVPFLGFQHRWGKECEFGGIRPEGYAREDPEGQSSALPPQEVRNAFFKKVQVA